MEIPSLNGRFYPVPIKSEQESENILKILLKTLIQLEEREAIGGVDIDDCIYQSMLIKQDIENNKWTGPVMGKEFKIK